jgi:hypothetical protein
MPSVVQRWVAAMKELVFQFHLQNKVHRHNVEESYRKCFPCSFGREILTLNLS